MAHRNRWFTELNNGGFPVFHNQMVNPQFLLELPSEVPYPLVICQIAIENGPVEIVDFPIDSMVDLSSSLCKRLPGRVNLHFPMVFPWFSYGIPQ